MSIEDEQNYSSDFLDKLYLATNNELKIIKEQIDQYRSLFESLKADMLRHSLKVKNVASMLTSVSSSAINAYNDYRNLLGGNSEDSGLAKSLEIMEGLIYNMISLNLFHRNKVRDLENLVEKFEDNLDSPSKVREFLSQIRELTPLEATHIEEVERNAYVEAFNDSLRPYDELIDLSVNHMGKFEAELLKFNDEVLEVIFGLDRDTLLEQQKAHEAMNNSIKASQKRKSAEVKSEQSEKGDGKKKRWGRFW